MERIMGKVFIIQQHYQRECIVHGSERCVPKRCPQEKFTGKLRPKYDLRDINQYGQPIEVLHWQVSPLATAPAMAELRNALRNYSDDDYLLAIGAGAFLIAAGAIAAQHNNGRVHVLYWNGDAQKYFPLTFDVNHSQYKESIS